MDLRLFFEFVNIYEYNGNCKSFEFTIDVFRIILDKLQPYLGLDA
jgi:hypothetical protein